MKTIFHGMLVLGVVLAAVPVARAQSLADVARQEEARRKTIKAPAKVYTNEDLRDAGAPPEAAPAQAAAPSPAGAPAAAPPPSPSGADAAKPATEPPAPPADEAAWKQRMSTARDNLARAQTFAEALQSRINALATDFAARSDPAQRAVISTDRQKALAELDRVKQEIQQHEKSITDIQEEARKAGVPAGWVR
jgi:hypothetical protein